jgi:hypothetical protein
VARRGGSNGKKFATESAEGTENERGTLEHTGNADSGLGSLAGALRMMRSGQAEIPHSKVAGLRTGHLFLDGFVTAEVDFGRLDTLVGKFAVVGFGLLGTLGGRFAAVEWFGQVGWVGCRRCGCWRSRSR